MCPVFYGVGVGPGDPELMTIKACRLIRENEYIAVPSREAKNSAAYKIALKAVPELAAKKILSIDFPMTNDSKTLEEAHKIGAQKVEEILSCGKSVVFLTLGDVGIYSTYFYLHEIIKKDGYETECVSGISSFSAGACLLQLPLVLGSGMLHIYSGMQAEYADSGTVAVLKAGKNVRMIAERLSGRKLFLVENCGMAGEKIYDDPDDFPGEAGYFSMILAFKQTADAK